MKAIYSSDTLSVTKAREKFKSLTEDPTAEILLTRDGDPVGVYVGIQAWRAIQDLLGLMQNPEALTDSLTKHRQFQASGNTDGVSLEELQSNLTHGRANAGTV